MDANGVLNAVFDATNNALRLSGSAGSDTTAARAILQTHATATVVNTIAETNLFSLTIPTADMAAGTSFMIRAAGDLLNDSAASVNYTWRLKFGGTTFLATVATSMNDPGAANRRQWTLDGHLVIPATDQQRLSAVFLVGAAGADGAWTAPQAISHIFPGYASGTVDTETDKAVAMTVEMGTAAATADCRLHFAEIIKVP